ncbi:Craniofacial development protein 1 [Blattella germanica]|nr:Craniofacial development protein 1 [Blattella germanica]
MDERELPSDSDESDEDYVPSGAESNPPSEEEFDGEDENELGDSDAEVEDTQEPEVEQETPEEKALTEEEEKKKADSLWSDFLKDTGGSVNRTKSTVTNGNKKEETSASKIESQKAAQKENKVTITKVFEFAGEEVRGGGGGGLKGLSSVLGQLGKKAKLGTLEKSKLDWDRFKQDEGLDEEIQIHNKGKDGYLERQDFLQRTDLRQFEIEKDLRTSRRSNR